MTNMECSQEQQQQSQEQQSNKHQRIKLSEINSYLTCHLCKGYLIDATTISECLHSFCRSCIIKFLQDKSHCPVCEVLINKAKPNLKLDKTLQDIVYKLVPELFLSEMCRRQAFYRRRPEHASQVSPEQRGEDTERTIFNPRDTFSLSIEYISDDSTPGAILLPSSKPNIEANNKNGTKCAQKETENMMRRFLQCPGMLRVDVLKKFVRNKYNVDTNRFHIDILYKRVPLPDHYTLIDIAYIYSWKRNEPMKFFFRITDIKLVKERFDYLEPTIGLDTPIPPQPVKPTKPSRRSKTPTAFVKKSATPPPPVKLEPATTPSQVSDKIVDDKKVAEETEKLKDQIKNGKNPVYTNITLNRSNNVEIITKIQKVSNKNGQPIGLNIIKQTVKKSNRNFETKKEASDCVNKTNGAKTEVSDSTKETPIKNEVSKVEPIKINGTKVELNSDVSKTSKLDNENKPKAEIAKSETPIPKDIDAKPSITLKQFPPKEAAPTELDIEKERFLKSIELTARSVLDNIAKSQKKELEAAKTSTLKRKLNIPYKQPKKPKLEKKSPVKRNKNINVDKSENLKTLLNTCKIPSSLSITCVKGDRETQIKPVINHIEILKLPEPKPELDEDKQKLELEKVGTTMQPTTAKDDEKKIDAKESKSELSITITIENPNDKTEPVKPGVHPNLPKMLPPLSGSSKTPTRSPSFQKMFEESIKKPETPNRTQIGPKPKAEASSSTTSNGSNKRNILEIASQLYKKTKLEQEKNAKQDKSNESKIAIPRLNTQNTLLKNPNSKTPPHRTDVAKKDFQQTVANLHSASLGMNYSVSVNQNGQKADTARVPPVKTDQISSPKPPQSPKSHMNSSSPKLPISPKIPLNQISPKLPVSSHSPKLPVNSHSPKLPVNSHSPKLPGNSHSPKLPVNSHSPKLPVSSHSPKLPMNPHSPKLPMNPHSPLPMTSHSPKLPINPNSPKLPVHPKSPKLIAPKLSPHPPSHSPRGQTTSSSPRPQGSPKHHGSPKDTRAPSKGSPSTGLDPNQLLEKYNIQNLAQLTASFNFNPAAMSLSPANQIAALQQAMLYKRFEMQNRQNWLNMNSNTMVQYLQSLSGNGQGHLLSNIKEN